MRTHPGSRIAFAALAMTLTFCFARQALAAQPFTTTYTETGLVSDQPSAAVVQDTNLVNPWGIVISPTGTIWIADNGKGVASTYNTSGQTQSTVVTIPLPPGSSASSAAPTGIVFNATTDFNITSGNTTAPATFIFVTEDGTISGWNSTVDATHAILTVNNSGASAVYKGVATGSAGSVNYIYATNFRTGNVDVFDGTFAPVLVGKFADPKLPKGYAPFGIRNINGQIYVTYAVQDDAKHDDVAGKGHGAINIFDTSGNLVRRFAAKGALNSPWGMDIACINFGTFNGALLVGNFGDGHITGFDFAGKEIGQLTVTKKQSLSIQGLWGITFGLGCGEGDRNTIFFASGPDDEAHGLFGTVTLTVP